MDLTITDHATVGHILADGSGYDEVADAVIHGPFEHVVSIVGTWHQPGKAPAEQKAPGGWDVWMDYPARKLRLVFDDVSSSDLTSTRQPPTQEQVAEVIEFARSIGEGRVLVHCGAGISRGTGVALAMLATVMGPGREIEAMERLMEVRDVARPHEKVVWLADQLLERNQALYRACASRFNGWGSTKRLVA